MKSVPAPWLNPGLKKSMFERDKLKKIACRLKTNESWSSYKSAKNQVNEAIKLAKSSYYNAYFAANCGNIKNSWKGINLIMAKTPQLTKINTLKIGDVSYSSPREISDVLNNHFSNVGPSLASEIPPVSIDFSDYINPVSYAFTLTETSIDTVLKLINSLPLNKACGLDGISCRLLKEAAPIVAPSLTHIINLSITTGIFPDEWKLARVSPIYKEGVKSDPNNYRPISVLPVISKLIERVVFDQFYEYLIVHDLLADTQSGFRPRHSTQTALLEATNEWYLNIDNGLINGVLFLDLKKAFDTVDHRILLQKLQLYGVDSNTLMWFKSYLTDRKQKTFVNGQMSDFCPIICGVPQGSILGPLLFLIYINDLPACHLHSVPRMYADDTSLTLSSSDPLDLQSKLNHDLAQIQTWLQANKLSLNVKKTKFSIIGSHNRLANLNHQFDVKINEHYLERAKTYKYLGIDLDESLSWDSHIDNVVKKASAGLGAIKRVRNLVPRETLITIYKALVQPYFDYCSSVWGSIGVCQSERLQKLQNRAARLITFSDLNVRSSILLGDLGWDCLERRRSKQLAINLFKALHNLSPIRLTSIFKTTSSVHSHNLRNSKHNLFVPRPSTEAGKRSFQYRGSVLWNSLPLSAKTQPTLGSFKSSLCH